MVRQSDWHCHSKKYFSVKLGTVMESSRLPLRKWVVGLYLMASAQGRYMKLHREGLVHGPAHPRRWMGGSLGLGRDRGRRDVASTSPGDSGRAVVGARERGSSASACKNVRPGSMVYTDEHRSYRRRNVRIGRCGTQHGPVCGRAGACQWPAWSLLARLPRDFPPRQREAGTCQSSPVARAAATWAPSSRCR